MNEIKIAFTTAAVQTCSPSKSFYAPKYCLKRQVFKCFWKHLRSVSFLSERCNEFQSLGAMMENSLSPKCASKSSCVTIGCTGPGKKTSAYLFVHALFLYIRGSGILFSAAINLKPRR
jgi:hypothetical protein